MDIVEGFIDEDYMFVFSKEHSQLEYYECFHDPSSKYLISGKELLGLKSLHEEKKEFYDWEIQRKRWLYFYRPYNYGTIIGRKQRKWIDENELKISDAKKTIIIGNFLSYISFFFMLVILYFYLFSSFSIVSLIIPVLLNIYFYFEKDSLLKKISYFNKEIKVLKKELDHLFLQKKEMTDAKASIKEIEEMFWGDVTELESHYAYKIFNKPIDDVETYTSDFYESVKTESREEHKYPKFPVIPSWGLLQQSEMFNVNANKPQATGIKLVSNDIGEKIATWRKAKNKNPIFRIWYIQFLFFHNKNLTIQSFYYDFITQEKYSEFLETYQYNHITNYSYLDEDISYMNTDPLIKSIKIPEKLTQNIFCDEVKTLSFSSASGSHYRCVIPDNDVKKGINDWLKHKENERKMMEEAENSNGEKIDELLDTLDAINKYEGLIQTLAWQSFRELREKVAQFALIETDNK